MASRLGWNLVLISGLVACAREHEKKPQIFFGECSVKVESKTRGAEIQVDGIVAGHDSVAIQIPCGEKQIKVVKEGYVPYVEYLPTSVAEPLKVTVTLETIKHHPDLALSNQLIESIRTGKKFHDERVSPTAAYDDWEAPAPTGPAKAATASASAAATASWSTNVEDWR